MPPELVLASASPRRRELLARLVETFSVVPAGVDEALDPGDLAAALRSLAAHKAGAVAVARPGAVVLGADTVVVDRGRPLGKPSDPDDARRMLARLAGRAHQVLTALAVVDPSRGLSLGAVVTSLVWMRAVEPDAIAAYVATSEPVDKAGAYAIQGLGAALVAGVSGSYSNVVGLPLAATRGLLEAAGVAVKGGARAGGDLPPGGRGLSSTR